MNTNPQLDQSQLDLHPDAESLSAFAEHQLPEHQRQPILAHLASCAQCRQILFLAQDAKEPEQPANPGPVLHFSAKKPATNWRYTWGALAACTALATISVLLYPRYRTAVPEQAKVITPLQTPAGSIAAPPTEEKKPRSEPSATIPQLHRAEKPAPKSEMNLDAAVAPSAPAKPAVQQPAAQQQASAGSSTTLMNITLKPAQTSQTVEVQAANQALTQSESQTVNVAANSAQIQPETPPLAVTMDAQQLQPNDQIKLQSRNVQPSGARHPAPTSTAVSGGTGNGLTPGAGGSIHAGAAGGSGASAAAAAKSPAAFAKMAPPAITCWPSTPPARCSSAKTPALSGNLYRPNGQAAPSSFFRRKPPRIKPEDWPLWAEQPQTNPRQPPHRLPRLSHPRSSKSSTIRVSTGPAATAAAGRQNSFPAATLSLNQPHLQRRAKCVSAVNPLSGWEKTS